LVEDCDGFLIVIQVAERAQRDDRLKRLKMCSHLSYDDTVD
jgi:hypothetical protein